MVHFTRRARRSASLLLLLASAVSSLVAAPQAAPPQAVPPAETPDNSTPATPVAAAAVSSSAQDESVPSKSQDVPYQWLDRTREALYGTMWRSAEHVDRWFGSSEDDSVYQRVYGSIAPALLYTQYD